MKKGSITEDMKRGIYAAAVGIGIALVLLLLAALIVMEKGMSPRSELPVAVGCLLLAGVVSGILIRGSGSMPVYLGACVGTALLILAVLSAADPSGKLSLTGCLPGAAGLSLGIALGQIVKNNKTDRRKRRHR